MGGDIFTAALPVKPVLRLFAFIVTKYDYNGDEMKGEVLVKLKNNALIGIEITFSDVMLSHMRLEIKDYKADPYNNLGFEEYCEQVQTAYHNWWVKYIPLKQKQRQKNISNNYFTLASPGEYLKSKMGSTEPKKKDESSCNMMVKFPYVRDGQIYDPKKEIVRSNGKIVQWAWYLDVDECCLEIHAPPLTFAEYQDEGIKEIIESHIYDAAKVKNIKAGEDGKGGGHLSVDMASGFDNEPRLVLKTLLLWEVLQYCIDEYKNTIDTKDNKNAGYIFDCSRKCFINQLENQFTCKVNIGSTAKLRIDHTDIIKWLLEYTRINVMSYKKRTDAFKKIKLTSLLINTLNDMYIGKNAKSVNDQIDIYIKNITDLQKLLRDNPIHEQCESKGKIAAEFSNHILHYQNINLEHALEPPPADQNKLPTSRIEFRRFVSQASYADLKDDIESLLNMIAFSRAVVDKRLSKLVCNMQHFIIRRKWS